MKKIHLLIPTILITSSIPMVSMVGCGKKEPESPESEPSFLTFTATDDCEFSVYYDNSGYIPEKTPNLYYSINDEDWTEYEMPTSIGYGNYIELNDGDTIKFYGDNKNGFCKTIDVTQYYFYDFKFDSIDNKPCGIISGNIMSLLAYDFRDLIEIPCDGCFYRLFENSDISDASNLVLPADQLSPYCYFDMFAHCTSLTTAPELPATELAECCYFYMFNNCTSLHIKKQQAKTEDDGFIFTCPESVPKSCVQFMFSGCICTGFRETPSPNESYYWHIVDNEPLTFTATKDCTFQVLSHGSSESPSNLEYSIDGGGWKKYEMPEGETREGEEIPLGSGNVIKFRGDNYYGFSHLNEISYTLNFFCEDNDCGYVSHNIMSLIVKDKFESINSIPCDGCFYNLFENSDISDASNLVLPADQLSPYCYFNMFAGCTSLTSAPELPATTLAERCYQSMFGLCASLTTAPELPAATLAEYCYGEMFAGCTSLTSAPELPATTLAENCYQYMFESCTSLITAPAALPAEELAVYCYSSMFYGCTTLTTAPALPATTLASHCYDHMFYKCSSLTQAPVLPATTLVDGCYQAMFQSCSSLHIREQDTKTEDDGFIFTRPDVPLTYVFDMFSNISSDSEFKGDPQVGKSYYWYT